MGRINFEINESFKMFKLSTGLRNRFIISQIQIHRRLCQTDQCQPSKASIVRVRFAPSPTGCFHYEIYIGIVQFLIRISNSKAIYIWVVYELPYTITCLPRQIMGK